MPSGPHAFVADAAERLIAPPPRANTLARLGVATFAALALELAAFALIYFERAVPAPAPEPIPVEIVVEPPPPPPPPPPEASPQPQPQAQEYEKPATDAPREGKSDHDDDTVAEKPKPAAAPPPPAPSPSPETVKPAETPAPELAKTDEAEAPPPAKEQPPAPPKPSVLAALPKTFDDVPDVDFGGEAMKSPVTGGNAKSTYISVLYGLVVPRLRVPAVAHAYGRRLTGVVAFMVDGRGRLTQRFVAERSGSMELDEAAMQAVAAAAHAFPPPPHGAPIGMKFTYTVN
jgi:periplasmic protein TonB